MAMVACKECGKEISTSAAACPNCGAKVKKPKLWLWIPLGLVVAFLTFGAIVGNTPEGKAKAEKRHAIEYCWDEQKRKSNDPASQRFIAGACEKMEEDFVRQYGVKP